MPENFANAQAGDVRRHRARAAAVARRDGRLPRAARRARSRSGPCRGRCSRSCRSGSRPPATRRPSRRPGASAPTCSPTCSASPSRSSRRRSRPTARRAPRPASTPTTGIVTLMLHTFVGDDARRRARDRARAAEAVPRHVALAAQGVRLGVPGLPATRRASTGRQPSATTTSTSLADDELDAVLEFAFERYYETSGLFGTPERCRGDGRPAEGDRRRRDRLPDRLRRRHRRRCSASLPHLDELRRQSQPRGGTRRPRRAGRRPDQSVAAQLARHGVTHLQCTPSMARMLTTAGRRRGRPSARVPTPVHRRRGVPGRPGQGPRRPLARAAASPTCTGRPRRRSGRPPGRSHGDLDIDPDRPPIANTQRLRPRRAAASPLPPGVPGELWIGGDGVVRGYHERPELTAERFVARPVPRRRPPHVPHRRPRALGQRRDGTAIIEFLGRADHQVKIRGYRIELGEIEARLGQHAGRPRVRRGRRARTRPATSSSSAYVSAAHGATRRRRARSRTHLRERAARGHGARRTSSCSTTLPHTPNGKIDRKALPRSPRCSGAAPARPRPSPPATSLERPGARGLGGDARHRRHRRRRQLLRHRRPLAARRADAPPAARARSTGRSPSPTSTASRRCAASPQSLSATDGLGDGRRRAPTAPPAAATAHAASPMRERDERTSEHRDDRRQRHRHRRHRPPTCPARANAAAFWRNLRDGRRERPRARPTRSCSRPGVTRETLRRARATCRRRRTLDGRGRLRRRVLRLLAEGSGDHGPAAPPLPRGGWEALEDAGHVPDVASTAPSASSPAAAWAATSCSTCSPTPTWCDDVGLFLLRHTGNDKDFLATRASYLFNLRGPVRQRADGLLDLARRHPPGVPAPARRASATWRSPAASPSRSPTAAATSTSEGEILSPDGHCRAFDHRSQGTVFGSGAGVVALRRLEDALADGDQIYAVIKGTAVNNDGARKVGYLAPVRRRPGGVRRRGARPSPTSSPATRQLRRVPRHRHADGRPDRDRRAHPGLPRRAPTRPGFCRIGSVKTNIGHLDTAAGVASLIKVALALRHGELPPSLNFEEPNPQHRLRAQPVLRQRPSSRRGAARARRRGGPASTRSASAAPTPSPSLEERAAAPTPTPSDGPLAAARRSRPATAARSTTTPPRLAAPPARPPRPRPRRRGLDPPGRPARTSPSAGCSPRATATEAIDAARGARRPARLHPHRAGAERRRVAFMFPGGGSQYPRMAADLYASEPVFAEHLDAGLAAARATPRHRPAAAAARATTTRPTRRRRSCERAGAASCRRSSSSSTPSPAC